MIPVEFIKMLMISDLGDKLIQILIGLFVVLVAYFAWWTTNTTEQPHYRTVLLVERRFRRRISRSRLSTHIQSTSIVSRAQPEEESNPPEDNQIAEETPNPESSNKPPEASTSSQGEEQLLNTPPTRSVEDQEIEDIVRIMDADANEVRQRRLAYYDNRQQGNQATTSTEDTTTFLPDTSNNLSCDKSEPEVVEELLMEHNYAERDAVHVDPVVELDQQENNEKSNVDSDDSTQTSQTNDSNIRIKLKYLNDDLKLVDGRLEEQLGDFKRRHFHVEFSSNKLVRLIFNGQVLQPDTETLQNCGLFDNCVVHCLVHQQRNVHSDSNTTGNTSFPGMSNTRSSTSGLSQGNNNNNNQGRDWDLGNILFALVSIILGSAWYFRYEYAHLYTVTATVALVAITGIFTIFLIGVYFPDPEPQQPRSEQRTIPT